MLEHIKRGGLVLYITCFFFSANDVAAQNAVSSSTSKKMHQLQDYMPPPMFNAPLLTAPSPLPERTIKKPRAVAVNKTQLRPNSIVKKIPRPPKKPKSYENREAAMVVIPTPPVRPKIMNASRNFIQGILKTQKQPVKQEIQEAAENDMWLDMLAAENLKQPSVQEVLANIEPAAGGSTKQITGQRLKEERNTTVSLGYLPGVPELPNQMKPHLLENISKLFNGQDDNSRISIMAFASAPDDSPTSARRLSLLRALNVRDFLVDHKINPLKIDIHPLGNETEQSPLDRVDIVIGN